MTPNPTPRWFQFSLRTLMAFVTLCAVVCSWLGVKLRQTERERNAVSAIEKIGGEVILESPSFMELPTPNWLRFLSGEHVTSVRLSKTEATDAGLVHLKELNELRELSLNDCQVSDAGLKYLDGLTQLESLNLRDTQVTDKGLEHLKGLIQLEVLDLTNTKVTDEGLEHLRRLTHLQSLKLNNTQITDKGLNCLKGLTELERLYLIGTNATAQGKRDMRRALPECHVFLE